MPTKGLIARAVAKTFLQSKSGERVEALKDLSLEIEESTFVSVIGPSGCGKTTLLRLLNGLIPPDSGEITISGQPPYPGPGMGFVFQSFRLIPWRTVRENISFPLEVNGKDGKEMRSRTDRLLSLVGLSGFANAYPSEVSGGMRQRVALARALVTDPQILLMDEPFAGIDAQARELMRNEFMQLHALRGGTVVFVTHSVDEAALMGDRVVLLGPRPGRVVEIVDIDLPRPRQTFELRSDPRFVELRNYLWDRIRKMVAEDPASDFYGR